MHSIRRSTLRDRDSEYQCIISVMPRVHVVFAEQGVDFFRKFNYGAGFILDVATDLSTYQYDRLKEYDLAVMLNVAPSTAERRESFRQYIENGGGWMGFYAAAYNDKNTRCP